MILVCIQANSSSHYWYTCVCSSSLWDPEQWSCRGHSTCGHHTCWRTLCLLACVLSCRVASVRSDVCDVEPSRIDLSFYKQFMLFRSQRRKCINNSHKSESHDFIFYSLLGRCHEFAYRFLSRKYLREDMTLSRGGVLSTIQPGLRVVGHFNFLHSAVLIT